MLFTSSFGTPVCGCPDGTYEEDDDPDEDVCEPVLGGNPCNKGQVSMGHDDNDENVGDLCDLG